MGFINTTPWSTFAYCFIKDCHPEYILNLQWNTIIDDPFYGILSKRHISTIITVLSSMTRTLVENIIDKHPALNKDDYDQTKSFNIYVNNGLNHKQGPHASQISISLNFDKSVASANDTNNIYHNMFTITSDDLWRDITEMHE